MLSFYCFAAPSYRSQIAEKYKLNSDTVGWINVPGTNINDVVVKNPPGNNEYYLTHDFFGNEYKDGTFCADMRSSFKPNGDISRVTTVYGHTWREDPSGDLFHQLKRYIEPDFARTHPNIYFSTEYKDMVWEIFSVFYTTYKLPYNIPDVSWDCFNRVIEVAQASSLYDYGIEINESDKILAISTCTYNVPGVGVLPEVVPNNYRFVIMARLVESSKTKKSASFTINNDIMQINEQPRIIRDDPEFVRIYGTEKENNPPDA